MIGYVIAFVVGLVVGYMIHIVKTNILLDRIGL